MKFLILTEIVAGRGHQKAAESIAKTIKIINPSDEVKIINLIAEISIYLEKIIEVIYMMIITRTPKIWGWIHGRDSFFSSISKEIISLVMLKNLQNLLKKERPDCVIVTHASGLGALSKLRRKYNFKIAAVFTDYQINQFWIHPNIDYYFVAHQDFKERLIRQYCISAEKICATGIPIDPKFFIDNHDQKKTKQFNIGASKDRFNILIMGGGLGLGGIKEIIYSLNRLVEIPINVIVVTGTNQKLFNELNKIISQLNIPVKLLGYVDNMVELMKECEVLITKPGGLTISEALAMQLPMIIFQPLPGQEVENSKFLVKHKAAISVDSNERINKWVRYLYQNKEMCMFLKENQFRIANPNAALQIVLTIRNESKKEPLILQK